MHTNANVEPIRRPLHGHIKKHGLKLSALTECTAVAITTLARYGLVDPKLKGVGVKRHRLIIEIQHYPVLDGIRAARCIGAQRTKDKTQVKTFWMLPINDRCAVVWQRLDPLN